jgi:hypothetical protein
LVRRVARSGLFFAQYPSGATVVGIDIESCASSDLVFSIPHFIWLVTAVGESTTALASYDVQLVTTKPARDVAPLGDVLADDVSARVCSPSRVLVVGSKISSKRPEAP